MVVMKVVKTVAYGCDEGWDDGFTVGCYESTQVMVVMNQLK